MKKSGINNKGMTLIELVVVVAVMSILSSVAIPNVANITKKAKEQVCKVNKNSLMRQFEIHNSLISNVLLEDYISNNSDEIKHYLCPAGGVLAPQESDLLCSIHDKVTVTPDPGDPDNPGEDPGEDPGDSVPDLTVIPNTNGLKVTYTGEVSYLSAGETVYYNGKYYVCVNTGSNPYSSGNAIIINADSGVKNITDWKDACSYEAFVLKYGSIEIGDMINFYNKYYVFSESNPSWMQLPGNWPWVMLNGQ